MILPAASGSGFTVTAKLVDAAPFPHSFVPVTVMFPDAAIAEKLTVMEFVFVPPVIEAPVGNVHEYPVALAIVATE